MFLKPGGHRDGKQKRKVGPDWEGLRKPGFDSAKTSKQIKDLIKKKIIRQALYLAHSKY